MGRSILYIKHRSVHHAENSGYSKLIDFVDSDYLPKDDDPYYIPFKVRKLVTKAMRKPEGYVYNAESLRKEMLLVHRMLKEKNGIAHFLNGERDIHFSPAFRKRNKWKIVATFHKPPEILKKSIAEYKYLRGLDGAIAVGSNQVSYLREKLATDNVAFIPHGVDTQFFTPAVDESNYEQFTAMFVGYHLRDIETLIAAAELLKKKFPAFKLKVVMKDTYRSLFPANDMYEFYSNIPDDELRHLYQTSSILLIPLKDSTACNSVLEGMACGLPTVTTDTGSIRDYVNEKNGILVKNKDSESLAKAAIYLMEDREANMKMRSQSRAESLQFGWEQVAKQMVQQYNNWFP